MTEWIDVSAHAAQRWHERTDSPGCGPVVAWAEGSRRIVPALDADEVRYHEPTQTLLLRKNEALVTVLDAQQATERVQRQAGVQ